MNDKKSLGAWAMLRKMGYKLGHVKGTKLWYISKNGEVVTEMKEHETVEDATRSRDVYAVQELERLGIDKV